MAKKNQSSRLTTQHLESQGVVEFLAKKLKSTTKPQELSLMQLYVLYKQNIHNLLLDIAKVLTRKRLMKLFRKQIRTLGRLFSLKMQALYQMAVLQKYKMIMQNGELCWYQKPSTKAKIQKTLKRECLQVLKKIKILWQQVMLLNVHTRISQKQQT